jgi:hypothetical protein
VAAPAIGWGLPGFNEVLEGDDPWRFHVSNPQQFIKLEQWGGKVLLVVVNAVDNIYSTSAGNVSVGEAAGISDNEGTGGLL